jgi:DNA polymerase III subunit gamma/tau
MPHEPLSIRYRPKKFSEVVGQEVPVRILSNAFTQDNLHHAFILEGQHGSGKTTVARILAASENCETGKTLDPCGKCSNCLAIFEGKSIDVKEIDAASNRGVDDVRQIREEIRYSPMQCRTKYVILDEAHSLTAIAAEALLKSIEEPPPYVRFILATTEAHSLKPTIHSRCQVLRFTKIPWHQIYDHLTNVSQRENIKFEEEALRLAAKKAKGSIRDSLQHLQSMKDFCGSEKITVDAAQKVLGEIDSSNFFDIIEHIVTPDVPKAMLAINELLTKTGNAEQIIRGLVEHMSDLSTTAACRGNVAGLGIMEDEVKRYLHQSQKAKPMLVVKMLKLMLDVKRASLLNMPVEAYLRTFIMESVVEKVKMEREAAAKEPKKP